MPRRLKGTMLKGRKVRDLETGRFFTNKGYLVVSRKNRVYCAEHRDELMASLKKAQQASYQPDSLKRRGIAISEGKLKNVAHLEKQRKDFLGNWDDPDFVEMQLENSKDQAGTKIVEIDGKEYKYVKKDCIRDGKLAVVYEDSVRSKTVGVVVGG